ncbi:CBF/Mak21 family-domain-containing protein [Mycena maculata]|uniref:CBF/Mak21 family-domain-containing protein n=1 Tax=Mycena maculata TaxID=230809 RepID=A0AAD7HK18_9AGAR|nr:CBF/Mak21 family-domain-containing protein [Mycena maculata]
MVRVRKEKGSASGPATSTSSGKQKSSKKSRSGDALLQEQVLALGGTKADYDLVKNTKEPTSGSGDADPTLSKDVSQFLKGLNLGGQDDLEEGPSTAKSIKAFKKAKKPVPKPGTPKDSSPKKKARVNAKATSVAPAVDAKAPKDKNKGPRKSDTQADVKAPATVAEEPRVQLPTKVTLNPKSHFILPPTSQWYLSATPLGASSSSLPAVSAMQLASFTTRASDLHTTDIYTFQTSSSSNSSASEANFLSKIIQSGTLSDRLSALTLLVQSSPLHNTKALETLKGMAERGKGKGGREESLKALRCVVDWWVGGGAPDRKLKYMRDQPLSHPSVTDQHLLLWYFEDWLKKYFFSILQILETLSLDPLPYVRTQALTLIFTLLRDKPEQEQNLLRLLVNKLGDTEKSICSRASHHLLQLLQSHPSMKAVIVREIIALVLRPPAPAPAPAPTVNKHIRFTDDPKPKPRPEPEEKKTTGNVHARYYATITFNQIVLSPGDRDVALQLIDVYFELFKELLGEGHVPDAEGDDGDAEGTGTGAEVKTDKGGRVRDAGKGKGKGKGKITEVKGAAGFAEVEDAHSKLISAILTGVNRALPFAKIEAGDVGLNKHIDTLFLITHTSTFNISLQALVLIQQISASLSAPLASAPSSSSSTATSASITDRYYRTLYASLHDNRLATSSKQAMYLNLLFKSLKADASNKDGERVKAIVRRFVQMLVSGGSGATEFIAGGLFLLGELFSSIPGLRSMLNDARAEPAEGESYDPRKRDPQYAHASASPLWELTPLLHHYHPAISLHARQLLSGQPLTASADLSLNTISHFLDRFVYKNPKKVKASANSNSNVVLGKGKGASAMQPAASGLEGGGVKLMKGEMGGMEERVNEVGFLRRREGDVPVDQVFFHKFFSRKSEKEKAKSAKAERRKKGDDDGSESDDEGVDADSDGGDDDESGEDMDLTGDEVKKAGDGDGDASEFDEEDSELGEGEVWKAMQASMPRAAGDEDLDLMEESSDEVPSDLEDEDDEDSNDALSLAEGSDNEDLVPLDGFPAGLIEYDGSGDEGEGEEEEEWGGIRGEGDKNKNGKRKREESSGQRRKKLRSLPTFASYEEYAKMIEDGPEDDI